MEAFSMAVNPLACVLCAWATWTFLLKVSDLITWCLSDCFLDVDVLLKV